MAGVDKDTEFLAINPAGFIPALRDGDVTMVESIAIMEYLIGRYGPTLLAPDPADPAFPAYQQFLHLGEAGLAASISFVVASRNLAPEAEPSRPLRGSAECCPFHGEARRLALPARGYQTARSAASGP